MAIDVKVKPDLDEEEVLHLIEFHAEESRVDLTGIAVCPVDLPEAKALLDQVDGRNRRIRELLAMLEAMLEAAVEGES